jgi:hypothetical protein
MDIHPSSELNLYAVWNVFVMLEAIIRDYGCPGGEIMATNSIRKVNDSIGCNPGFRKLHS